MGVLLAAGGCSKRSQSKDRPVAQPLGPVASVAEGRTTLPPTLPIADYVGAAVCGECHAAIYQTWQKSAHGRSTSDPHRRPVLAPFAGEAVAHEGGQVVPVGGRDAPAMEIRTEGGSERFPVDLTFASGRQQQLYFTRTGDTYTLLPIFWSTLGDRWVSTALYQPASLLPGSKGYWRNATLERMDCGGCHLSQRHRVLGDEPRIAYVDMEINCEACHGPGKAHVASRRAGKTDATYPDLKAIGKVAEGRLCGSCHGARKYYQLPVADDGWPQPETQTLAHDYVRPDGTQRMTIYQYTGHRLSRCYLDGAMTCSACHAPHDGAPRNLLGESAAGADSDKQCTVCHRDLLEEKAARLHSRHPAETRCVDCHMAFSWIGDDERRQQKTSDHSISIPRPAESARVGTPNACTTCHEDRDLAWAAKAVTDFGWREATEPRAWVVAVADGRKGDPAAREALVALATAADSSDYLRASALELLARQQPTPAIATAIEPLAGHANPLVRQPAIAALIVHDPARADQWRRRGRADEHPFVRVETFLQTPQLGELPVAAIEQLAEDATRYFARPVVTLIDLAKQLSAKGEHDAAVRLAEETLALATADERATFRLDGTVAHLRRQRDFAARKKD